MTVPTRPSARPARDWWRQALAYEIYPRSFADADGDGLGDLRGITSRVPYLAALGVDAVWLAPFYPSQLADGGYDVDDYRAVDPRLGTLEDFDALTAALHAEGIRVIVDIVPNHSSDRHRWFQEALASPPGSPERARYLFRDGVGDAPPSDWTSHFGGPAWTRVPDGQWYLHLFAPQQPDFDWTHPDVHEEFLRTLAFWADRGVDGFRIDVAHGLAKDLTEPLPPQASLTQELEVAGRHPWSDRDEVHEIYREWRQLFDRYDPPRTAVAEAWVHPSRQARYAVPSGLGQAFNFDLLRAGWDAEAFRTTIARNLQQAAQAGSSSTWVLSNHDVVRPVTRYGLATAADGDLGTQWVRDGGTAPGYDEDRGRCRALAALLLVLALPGSAYLYQGEELALAEVGTLPDRARQDPTFARTGGRDKGRDGCRVPLPWSADGPSFGFGSAPAHLPQPAWFGQWAVSRQQDDPLSPLSLVRRATALRRQLQGEETLAFADDAPHVVHVVRPGGWHSVTNFGEVAVDLPSGEVLLCSQPLVDGRLPGDASAWLRLAG